MNSDIIWRIKWFSIHISVSNFSYFSVLLERLTVIQTVLLGILELDNIKNIMIE